MVKYIRSTFERARQRFGTACDDIPRDIQERQRYFFDTFYLNDGRLPPTGRNCNICGKIGHFAKECPFNRSRRGKGQKTKDEKGQQGKQEKGHLDNAEKRQQNKKTSQTNHETDVQRAAKKEERNNDEKSSQNQNENNPENWAARIRANSIEKPLEGKQEMLGKNEIQGQGTRYPYSLHCKIIDRLISFTT